MHLSVLLLWVLKWIFRRAIFHRELLTRQNKNGIEPRLQCETKECCAEGRLKGPFGCYSGVCEHVPQVQWQRAPAGVTELRGWLEYGRVVGGGVVVWGRVIDAGVIFSNANSFQWLVLGRDHQCFGFSQLRPFHSLFSRWKMASGSLVLQKV